MTIYKLFAQAVIVGLVWTNIFLLGNSKPSALKPPEIKKYFGIHTNRLNAVGAREIKYIGANIVRTDRFSWDIIEPKKGMYNFTVSDQAVLWAKKNNLDVLGILLYTPPWESGLSFTPSRKPQTDCGIPPKEKLTNSADSFRVYPPRNNDDFAQFVYKTVKRYPAVKFWQIWNEVNNPIFWKQAPNADEYADMLKKSYQAVKKANPNAKVVLGGISLVDLDYLEKLYTAGAKDYFDVMAVHPYNPAQSPDGYLRNELVNLKTFMDNHGDAGKKIWLTEIGWDTSSTIYGIDETIQAEYVKQLYEITGSLDYVEAVFWHALEDCGLDYTRKEPEQNFGLFRNNHSPKLSAEAYRQLTSGQ